MKNTEELLEVNKRQKQFYNSNQQRRMGLVSKIWSSIRNGALNEFRDKYDIKTRVYDQHRIWLGDISDKKILDLGCLRGNALSLYMAENAREYVGIDLSDVATAILQKKIDRLGRQNASAIAVDFLSPEFRHADFDIIYAYGVLHHFANFDVLISRLKEKLRKGGLIISYDPLETSLPIRVVRAIYRPFQPDKDWEWPFTKAIITKIKENFRIEEMHGILGKSKYGFLLNILPIEAGIKSRLIASMVSRDWNLREVDDVYSCMHVTMLLRKI